ncbi:MAG: histidinol-phosphate transaminase [Halanaerobiales bacterium]
MVIIKNKYDQLVREEIHTLKPYIPGKPIEEVKKEYGLDHITKLASNENPLGVSERVKKAVAEELDNMFRYPDGGCRIIKKSLADKLRITEDMLLFGNGSDGLLKVIGEAFINKGDQVVISDPTFVEYIFVSNLMGAEIKRVKMVSYNQDIKKLIEMVTNKTKIVFLTSPHNPAGTIIKDKELKYFMESIPSDVLVILDEAYYEYVQDEEYPDVLEYIKEGYPIIALRTFSKAYGLAGLRIGYAIGEAGLIGLLSKAREPFNVNRISQIAARAALEDENFLKRAVEVNEEGKKYLYKELEARNIDYVPTESNFILVNIEQDSIEVFNKLLKMGVIIRPGKPLGYPGHIRVTIGLAEENKIFLNSIDKLLAE